MAGNYADLGLAYSQKVRSAATQRDASLASSAYSRFLSQQRGRRQQADLARSSNAQLGKLAASYGARGLRNSGVRQRGVSDFARVFNSRHRTLLIGCVMSNSSRCWVMRR